MVDAVTGVAVGQKLKNTIVIKYRQAHVLTAIPQIPCICHGPQLTTSSVADFRGCIPPVTRRYSRRAMAARYDDCRLETESETRSLNAVVDPRMMRESSKEMTVVIRMDRIGRAVRGSTLGKGGSASRQSKRFKFGEKAPCDVKFILHALSTSILADHDPWQRTTTFGKQQQEALRWQRTA